MKRSMLALILAFVVVAAACGGGDTDGGAGSERPASVGATGGEANTENATSEESSSGNETSEESPSDEATNEETPSVVVVTGSCEKITDDTPSSIPCVQEGVAMAGTAAFVQLVSDELVVICWPLCGEPGDWPFHQYLVELWVDDDRAILCDDDPARPCQLTDMQTFELLSPDTGIAIPNRAIADGGIGLKLTGPWGFDVETGGLEIGDTPITQIFFQWWHGEEPTESEIAILPTDTDDMIPDPPTQIWVVETTGEQLFRITIDGIQRGSSGMLAPGITWVD